MSFSTHSIEGKSFQMWTDQYAAGGLYVELVVDNEPYAALSICIPELTLKEDEFVFKTYSENHGLYQFLWGKGLIELVQMEQTELGMVPICRLTTPSIMTQESIV